MKTLVLGSYGNNNVGEDAVLTALLNRIGRKDVTVTSTKPLLTKAIHHDIDSIQYGMVEMDNYDKLIVGGCGIFYGDCSLCVGSMIEAYNMGIPVEVLNAEVGPIEDKAFYDVAYAFSIAHPINVRTNFSRTILQKVMGIKEEIIVEKDISCTLEVPSCEDLVEFYYGKGPYLGLSLKNFKIYYPNLIAEVKKCIKDGYTVVPILNAWSDFPARLDLLGINRFEKLMKKSFNRWSAPLMPPRITMGIVKEMDKVISHTVHTTIWANHYGIEATALVPENNFHPMAYRQLGAKNIIYTTPPGYIEKEPLFLSFKGLDWSNMEEEEIETISLG